MVSPKERFSDRVTDYVKYRPGYPAALFEALAQTAGLSAGSTIADVGSGTGIFSRSLLALGARVIALEPNAAMRTAAENELAGNPHFESRDGSAEATGLPDASVDAVTAAQAFHWFEPVAARAEFRRILKPRGFVALIWNQRTDNAANRAYEAMLDRYAPDYAQVREKDRSAASRMRAFFAPEVPTSSTFANAQSFDRAGLRGRLASSSFAPTRESPLYVPIYEELDRIFDAFAKVETDGETDTKTDGTTEGESGGDRRRFLFEYDTVLWLGRL
jgi:ubiquinone/menaquinone biosynthesis C-methylase UbiE